jgi:hypothetical protein
MNSTAPTTKDTAFAWQHLPSDWLLQAKCHQNSLFAEMNLMNGHTHTHTQAVQCVYYTHCVKITLINCRSVLMTYDLILTALEYTQVVFTCHLLAQVAGNLSSSNMMTQLSVQLYQVYHNFCPIPRIMLHVSTACRSQWPRGLRRVSAAVRLLGSWVRTSPRA